MRCHLKHTKTPEGRARSAFDDIWARIRGYIQGAAKKFSVGVMTASKWPLARGLEKKFLLKRASPGAARARGPKSALHGGALAAAAPARISAKDSAGVFGGGAIFWQNFMMPVGLTVTFATAPSSMVRSALSSFSGEWCARTWPQAKCHALVFAPLHHARFLQPAARHTVSPVDSSFFMRTVTLATPYTLASSSTVTSNCSPGCASARASLFFFFFAAGTGRFGDAAGAGRDAARSSVIALHGAEPANQMTPTLARGVTRRAVEPPRVSGK